MTREPITVPPEITNRQAIQLLLQHNISGLFVVDADGKMVGVITEFARRGRLYDPQMLRDQVADYMTRDVVTVKETDLLTEAANLMILHRFRRLPVLSDGEPVGIISRRDLLRFVSQSEATLSQYHYALTSFDAAAK